MPEEPEDNDDEVPSPPRTYAAAVGTVVPESLEQALASPQAEHWRPAMDAEFAALQGHGTWNLVELPQGRKAIACRWVYALKRDELGTIVRYKARLVAKGYSQQAGTDCTVVRAPVMGCTDGICPAFVLVPATYSTALHSQGIVAEVKTGLDGLLEQSRATDLAACF
jgi:hypothetical protein